MEKDVLSQDEVDALLKGGADDDDAGQSGAPGPAVQAYDLGQQAHIVRGRMPALEIINDRFARLLRTGLFRFMRRSAEISVGPVKLVRFSEFARTLAVPTNLNVVHMKPLRGASLFVFEPGLVFAVVDNLFGGDGRFKASLEGRDFTPTEQRIIQKMLHVVFEELQNSWQQVQPLTIEYVRSEMHAQFAGIAANSEIVVTSAFNIELGGGGGTLQICIPYSTLEPIRDLLYAQTQADSPEPDRRWTRMLSQQLQLAEVQLVAQFGNIPLTLGQVLKMKVGDVLQFDAPRSVRADVDGIPVFECKYGSQNGRYALRVESVLAVSQQENQLGD